MTPPALHRISFIASCAIVGLVFSTASARAQVDFGTESAAQALSTAAKASPELAEGLAKELGTTPEQAAGAAGVIFGIAKSLLRPDDFAAVAKAVPGMDALLATAPMTATAAPGSTFTAGFGAASSSPPGLTMAAADGMAAAIPGFSKLGIKPDMILKTVPFLSGYLKKYGGADVGSLLGGLFKTGK